MELSQLWSWWRHRRQEPESLFQLSPDPMLLVDTSGIIRRANDAAHQLLGYAAGSMAGKPVDILVPPSARNHHRHLITLFFSSTGERRMNNRIWIHDAKGQRINGEIHLVLAHWQGQPMALATIRDTSALWQEERKLREQRKAYDELFEHSAVSVWVAVFCVLTGISVTCWGTGVMTCWSVAFRRLHMLMILPRMRNASVNCCRARAIHTAWINAIKKQTVRCSGLISPSP